MEHYLTHSFSGDVVSHRIQHKGSHGFMRDVTLVRGPEWEGLYVNGLLVAEAEYLLPEQILDALDQDYEFIDVEESDHYIHVLPYELEDLMERMEYGDLDEDEEL